MLVEHDVALAFVSKVTLCTVELAPRISWIILTTLYERWHRSWTYTLAEVVKRAAHSLVVGFL